MSTSPSWFDQDKFSRLVKKVGPKTTTQPVAGQAVPAKVPSQPLIKEAPLPPESEEKNILPARKAPPTEATRLSQRLPKIELKSLTPEPDIVPAPIRAEAGALPTEIEEEAPALPEAVSRPPLSMQGMMTSQPLSLGKKSTPPNIPSGALRAEPIRAPEASGEPTSPESTPATPGTISRTSALPALKSLFQYEIPGGQGSIPAKESAALPVPKPPAFSFQKLGAKTPTENLPPAQDEEETVPSFSGISDAGHLAEQAEAELSAENLAAEWGKNDELKQELERVIKERDAALAESQALSQKLSESRKIPSLAPAADPEEIKQLMMERDQMRSQYITLRGDFETLKQEKLQAKKAAAPVENNPALEKEIENLRSQLAEKDREINKSKTTLTGMEDVVATLKEELNVLREEVKKAKDETSVAQRGLALSQKALQETREALKK